MKKYTLVLAFVFSFVVVGLLNSEVVYGSCYMVWGDWADNSGPCEADCNDYTGVSMYCCVSNTGQSGSNWVGPYENCSNLSQDPEGIYNISGGSCTTLPCNGSTRCVGGSSYSWTGGSTYNPWSGVSVSGTCSS